MLLSLSLVHEVLTSDGVIKCIRVWIGILSKVQEISSFLFQRARPPNLDKQKTIHFTSYTPTTWHGTNI
jgi:hypothetical protein